MPQIVPQSVIIPAVTPALAAGPAGATVPWGVSALFDYTQRGLLFNDSNDLLLGTETVCLSQRIIACLTTQRLKYAIYTDTFGSDLATMIGQNLPPPIIQSMAEVFVRSSIIDSRVEDIRNLVVVISGKSVMVSFKIVAITGFEKQFEAKWSV
jgi:hypothetical protein